MSPPHFQLKIHVKFILQICISKKYCITDLYPFSNYLFNTDLMNLCSMMETTGALELDRPEFEPLTFIFLTEDFFLIFSIWFYLHFLEVYNIHRAMF